MIEKIEILGWRMKDDDDDEATLIEFTNEPGEGVVGINVAGEEVARISWEDVLKPALKRMVETWE